MNNILCKVKSDIKHIDKTIVFISITIAFILAYYINPLDNVEIREWDRTFSWAIISGISIDKRVGEFYKLFLLILPGTSLLLMLLLGRILYNRKNYKEYLTIFSVLLFPPTFASYISRFSPDSVNIIENPMIECVIGFLIVLCVIIVLDSQERFDFGDVTMLFLNYIVMIITFNSLCDVDNLIISIIMTSIIEMIYCFIVLKLPFGQVIFEKSKRFLFLLMWLPCYTWVILEILYWGVEKGNKIQHYRTYVLLAVIIVVLLSAVTSFVIKSKKEHLFARGGYIGALVSIATIGFLPHDYQYIWSYHDYANMYELANGTVAVDSIIQGKVPIIDYFSAHALKDVVTRILYCFIHNDLNGIYVDPYRGLLDIGAYIILFYMVKKLFNNHIAILFVLLFPGYITGIKWISICCLPIVILLYIYRIPNIRNYLWFWAFTLVCAFYVYDEGISIGISCIVAYIMIKIIENEWRQLCDFFKCGIGVGCVAFICYILYAIVAKVPIIGRIREWMAVSVGSSSTWATANFGDVSSFAFLLSYFLVPITAVALFVFVIVKYIRCRKCEILVLLTIIFSLTEILYITRTIVFHNLAVCNGVTGVLLNFIHWTVSMYVLYEMEIRGKDLNYKLWIWVTTMFLVILTECSVVTHCLPTANSTLISKGIKTSSEWNLEDNNTDNIGKSRIVADENTTKMIGQFRQVFDVLLEKEETFLDFSNITSIYAMVERVRPFYVAQSPSLLTDLYSQEMFLEEIAEYNCPLAVIGSGEFAYLQHMGVPHNIRYYKIAEFIYNNYRPLIAFNDFIIWCEKDKYEIYKDKLQCMNFFAEGSNYRLVDYGYDLTTAYLDDAGNIQYEFMPYHSYDLGNIPFIWGNYDEYNAQDNSVTIKLNSSEPNIYVFAGSDNLADEDGNYLAFKYTNLNGEDIGIDVIIYDSNYEAAMYKYHFNVKPGTHQYLIRISGDYFWSAFNIDTVVFEESEWLSIGDVNILEGD